MDLRKTTPSLALALALGAGCGASQASPEDAVTVPQVPIVATSDPTPAPPPLDPEAPIALPSNPRPAPWREPAIEGVKDPLADLEEVATGKRAAVIRTGGKELFAVHEELGVVGPLALPEGARVIGLDDADRVYVVAGDGALHVAGDVVAAARRQFLRAGDVPGAVSWDVTAGMVVAAKGDEVLVSTDRGQSFTRSAPRKGTAIATVLARHDGVIAARAAAPAAPAGTPTPTSPALFLSRDRGKTWAPSAYSPAEIARDGAWIWNRWRACPAVLAADGRTWTVDAKGLEALAELPDWAEILRKSPTPAGFPPVRRVTIDDPPAPALRGGKGRVSPFTCKLDNIPTFNAIGGLGLAGSGEGCHGAGCLRGSVEAVPDPTRTDVAFFHDGACPPKAPGSNECADGAPFRRLPRVARIDRVEGKVRVIEVPPGCDPHAIHSAGGLSLLLCRERDATAVFALGPDGRWAHEGRFPFPAADAQRLAMSADGTAALHLRCAPGRACRALVRAPVAVGPNPDPIRLAALPDAIALRVLDGGAIVAIAGKDDRFHVLLNPKGDDIAALARDVVAGRGEIHGFRIDGAGRVALTRHPPGGKAEELLVTNGGKLVPNPDPEDWRSRHNDSPWRVPKKP